ncbi:MAG TPA: bifunctional riboflavin kinase/FAD synthetase [Candidatus Acidoferrales bacterium]|jgi:riboflavin kinase/FMN adenylyltransferase|nr:bifunctional riboflavin kinase/FAD synthetase [Candidatus Acidoferrales bacterium]
MPLALLHSLGDWAARLGRPDTVLTVGSFDGVHLGHQKILRGVVERARATARLAAVVTFDPHPLKVLRPEEAPPLIATLSQRLAGLERHGLDAALVLRFDLELSRLSPEEFVRGILVEKLGVRTMLVGENFRFGHRQAGDVHVLAALGQRLGFDVAIAPPVVVRGDVVSSTAIRQAVQKGQVERAARLLGQPFALTGEIRPGSGRGARMVFPTLNLTAEQELRPAMGVYATETRVAGQLYRSATNVGVRPTFDGGGITVESHLLNFSKRIANGPMEIYFWKRLREERRFAGPEALRVQIAKDLARTRSFFERFSRSQASREKLPHR